MENNDLLKSQLEVDNVAATHLYDTAKWGKFLAIVGFVLCGLFVLGGIWQSVYLSQRSSLYGSALSDMGPSIGIVYVIVALVYFFPSLFLFRFSKRMKTALNTSDQQTFNEALNQHRRMYKFVGILTIVGLCLYGLILIIVIIIGSAGGFLRF